MAILFGLAADARGELRFVDALAGGNGDGSSWLDAFTNLQTALAVADSGDVLWVARGVYRPAAGGDRDSSFLLRPGIELYGGFAGDESLLSQRDLILNITELNGDIGSLGSAFDNSYHVVTTSDCDSTCLLDGIWISGGLADGTLDNGGGILNLGGQPRIANARILLNQAAGSGGGVYSADGAPRFTNVRFENNWATTGAGLYNEGGGASFRQVEFTQNDASVRGGGLYDKAGGSLLVDVQFRLNGAFDGGAVYCDSASTVFEDVDLELNGADCFGGAIFSRKSDLLLRGVRIATNIASFSGGGIYVHGGSPRLIDVILSQNTCAGQAEDGGGGMYVTLATSQLVNVVFDRNSHLFWGGGLASVDASVDLVNVSFAGNRAMGQLLGRGGAIANRGGSSLTLSNVIGWGNQADFEGSEIFNQASTAMLSHCIVSGSGGSGPGWNPDIGSDGGQNLDFDPLFVDGAAGNVRLSIGSPAMNRGDAAAVPADIESDLDGNPRSVGESVDVGAYELIDALHLTQVTDIPNDQGRAVRLSFVASSLDVFGSSLPILQYESYRRIDAASKDSESSLKRRIAQARAAGMRSSAKILSQGWDYLGSIPAHASGAYNVIAPTLGDSTAAAIHWSTFFVRAATAQPTVYYDSPADSGYSIDNLAPAAPIGLSVAYAWGGSSNELDWDMLPEPDFSHFRIYRGATADFVAEAANLVGTTTLTGWLDAQWQTQLVHYKVSSMDFAGNESAAVAPLSATDVVRAAQSFAFLGSVPNPANSLTALRFVLPAAAEYVVAIFDSAGRRVWRERGHGQAGENSVLWHGRDTAGRSVASGAYFAQLWYGSETATQKVLLLR
jgi:hypothetical protein